MGVGTRIAEVLFGDLLVRPRLALSLHVEILYQRATVMLADEILDRLGEVIFLRKVKAIFDVADDDLGAGQRVELFARAAKSHP